MKKIELSPASSLIGRFIVYGLFSAGNSGGVLLNSAGNLIGMNTAIYSPSGASAGIGFAIPVDTIKYM